MIRKLKWPNKFPDLYSRRIRMQRLSWKEKIIYACGGLGFSLVTVIHMLYLTYYFFPPKDTGLPYMIPQGAVIFGLTTLGIIMAAGRLVDAVTDPLIASWSDNTRSKLGKRIPFMRFAAIGFAASHVLVFFVPSAESVTSGNIIWLAVTLALAALFMTLYVVPHTSLMVEIAHHPDDKIDLATLNSVLWFAGFLIVSFSGGMWDLLQNNLGISRAEAMRYTFVGIAVLGWLAMLVPAFGLDEKKYRRPDAKERTERQPLIPAFRKVFRNRDFDYFLLANTFYTISTYIFESGLIYYITVLARYKASAQGPITTVVGAITFASYPLMNIFSKRWGKKSVLRIGFVLFTLMFAAISLLGVSFIPIWLAMGLVILFAPIPQSIFGALPNAITADCAAWDRAETGEDSSAMYVAVNGFVHKLGATLATLVFTSMLLFGKDVGDDLGIRIAAIAGGVMSVLGLVIMKAYNEKKIMTYVEKDEAALAASTASAE